MAQPVTLYASHQLHALLNSPRFVITEARQMGYEVILSAPEINIQWCNTVNPASRMVLPDEGSPFDWIQQTEKCAWKDFHNEPIAADLPVFVTGLRVHDESGCRTGYGVVQVKATVISFTILQVQKVDQLCSAHQTVYVYIMLIPRRRLL